MESERDPDDLTPAELSGEPRKLTASDFREIADEIRRFSEAMRKRIERMEAMTADDYRIRVK